MEARPRSALIMIVIIENRHKFDRLRTIISFPFWQKKNPIKCYCYYFALEELSDLLDVVLLTTIHQRRDALHRGSGRPWLLIRYPPATRSSTGR